MQNKSIFKEFIPKREASIKPIPDLSNKQFGDLTVIENIPNLRSIYEHRVWKCRCTCGKELLVDEGRLLHGETTSCGCKRYPDLTGKRFGKLTALYRIPKSETETGDRAKWMCRCECGNEVQVLTSNLTKGNSTSCGECSRGVDLTNKRFTKLIALYRLDKTSKSGSYYWHCRCDCGKEVDIPSNSLLSGNTRSCGCYQKEVVSEKQTKYRGVDEKRISMIFHGMCQRCGNPNNCAYSNYGGRGIKVCEEWKKDIWSFINWSKSHGYAPGLSIDRIDVNGNYCPENCRWITPREQQYNTRRSVKISAAMMTMTNSEWDQFLGLPIGTTIKYYRQNGIDKTVRFLTSLTDWKRHSHF